MHDKVGLYREVRLAMTELYDKEDELYFGPLIVDVTREKESKEAIKKGSKRIQEKVKEIRQNFSKAVVSGSRSGSGKIVYEYYDKLISLWGGSANIEPLDYGVKADDFNLISKDQFSPNDSEKRNEEAVELSEIFSNNNAIESSAEDSDDLLITPNKRKRSSVSTENNENEEQSTSNKRKESCIPQLIDNKRKNLERNLSAAQRDQLLVKEARDDSRFRKDMAEAMRESTKSFTESIQSVSKSMSDLGNGISRSIEMLAQAMLMQTQQPINQNQFYQHIPPPQNVYMQMLNSFSPCSTSTVNEKGENNDNL